MSSSPSCLNRPGLTIRDKSTNRGTEEDFWNSENGLTSWDFSVYKNIIRVLKHKMDPNAGQRQADLSVWSLHIVPVLMMVYHQNAHIWLSLLSVPLTKGLRVRSWLAPRACTRCPLLPQDGLKNTVCVSLCRALYDMWANKDSSVILPKLNKMTFSHTLQSCSASCDHKTESLWNVSSCVQCMLNWNLVRILKVLSSTSACRRAGL